MNKVDLSANTIVMSILNVVSVNTLYSKESFPSYKEPLNFCQMMIVHNHTVIIIKYCLLFVTCCNIRFECSGSI